MIIGGQDEKTPLSIFWLFARFGRSWKSYFRYVASSVTSVESDRFEAHVEQGDKVVVGQQLISFDMDVIKEAGLVTETPVIITNQDDFQADVEGDLPRDIKRGDALMIAHRTK